MREREREKESERKREKESEHKRECTHINFNAFISPNYSTIML